MTRSTLPLIAAAASVLALAAAPAGAVDQAAVSSTACEPGSAVYKVSDGARAPKVTHITKVKVPAKKTRTVAKPALVIRTIEARATGTGDYDAAAVLVAAHRKYLKAEDAVAAPGDRTSTEPVEIGKATLRNPTSADRKYAGFSASNVWRGKWTLRKCGESAVLAKGRWRTFSVVELNGYALCPASNYQVGSASFQACKQVWN